MCYIVTGSLSMETETKEQKYMQISLLLLLQKVYIHNGGEIWGKYLIQHCLSAIHAWDCTKHVQRSCLWC